MAKFVRTSAQTLAIAAAATLLCLFTTITSLLVPGNVPSLRSSSYSVSTWIKTSREHNGSSSVELHTVNGPQLSTSEIEQRCRLTSGDWCYIYFNQKPIPWKPAPRGNITCLWDCNGVGMCDYTTGFCRCPAGWQGDYCQTKMNRPCSQRYRLPGSFEPYDEPLNISMRATGVSTHCAGECDKDIGLCFCPADTKYGRIPAAMNSPPNTPPRQFGRPMGPHCQPNETVDGLPIAFGNQARIEIDKWCNEEMPNLKCPCYSDKVDGPFCDRPKESFCVNQCNGHGECDSGFCYCHQGWYGQDCAYRRPGVPWTPGLEETERPWLKEAVKTVPASLDELPAPARRRPLIYVYELPPMYNQIMLQYRNERTYCIHRIFRKLENNVTYTAETQDPYAAETGLHEFLLQSEHRTLDPEEADFFYIPVYQACYNFLWSKTDGPYFHGGPEQVRAHHITHMMLEAWQWLRTHHPYWDRHGGRDHILYAPYDEGSCYVPLAMRNATILTHWGYTGINNVSFTHYPPDMFDQIQVSIYNPQGGVSVIGNDTQCYNPSKDLVIPNLFTPSRYSSALIFGNPTRERYILGFHKGRVMKEAPRFSRGTRQKMAELTESQDWWNKYKIYTGEGIPGGVKAGTSYSELLASSVFCFVLMGDGFTTRFEDAIYHGCIPVIVMDDVYVGFESIIDVTQFSLRVAVADMENIPEILTSVPQDKIEEMQRNIKKVWRRYFYSNLPFTINKINTLLTDRRKEAAAAPVLSQPEPELDYDPREGDAFETILQFLYSRLDYAKS